MSNLLQRIKSELLPCYDVREAEALARLICEDEFELSLVDILCGRELTDCNQERRLEEILRRLKNAEPIQYIQKKAYFCGKVFKVTPDVLIPRPETEDLVNLSLQFVQETENLQVCDACTGSGCIGISIKDKLPSARVTAFDLSKEALQIAKENGQRLKTEINWELRNLMNWREFASEQWNMIVSNPPYIRESERKEIEARVKDNEPEMALFVPDNNPLCFYEALAGWGMNSLVSGGLLVCEINAALAEETKLVFLNNGFKNPELLKDRYEKWRFIKAVKD